MTLENEVRHYIDETMSLEVDAANPAADVTDKLVVLGTGLQVMQHAILMVARRVDALETQQGL